MISNKVLLALFGFALVFSSVRAEDSADGKVHEEDEIGGASKDASVSFHLSYDRIKIIFAGRPIKFTIGFKNGREKDFIVKHAETSFRDHQDFNVHIQNFTLAQFNLKVGPMEEVTLDTSIPVFKHFSGRSLGLVVRLHYGDSDNQYFVHTAFNETITVANTDTIDTIVYLYFAFMGCSLLILCFGVGRKHERRMAKRALVVEQGTTKTGEVSREPRLL